MVDVTEDVRYENQIVKKSTSEHTYAERFENGLFLVPSIRIYIHRQNEPHHDKTNKVACASSEDSDQPGHPPSLIRVFALHMKKACVLSYPLSAQLRLLSDWEDVQADMSLRWAHSHFVGFDKRRLKYVSINIIHELPLVLAIWI